MSEQKRYTAQEMRDTLKCLFVNMIVGMRGLYCAVNSNDVIAMLRQAADAEDENAQLKARLAAVVKECEKQIPACRAEDCKCNPTESGYCDENCNDEIIVYMAVTAILRAALGEGGVE